MNTEQTKIKEQPSYYAVLTAEVRYSKVLKPMEKLMYAEITALSNATGECWATNKYFADLYGVTTGAVSKWIANLAKQGFVNRRVTYKEGSKQIEKRFVSLSTPMVQKDHTPMDQNDQTPMVQNDQVNTPSSNSLSLLGDFYPNETSLTTVSKEYGSVSDQVLHSAVEEFKDAVACQTRKPYADLQSAFRNWVRKGWIEQFNAKPKTHAQMSRQINQHTNGTVIPAPKSMKEIEEMLNQDNNRRSLQHG